MSRWPDAAFLTTSDHLGNTTADDGLEAPSEHAKSDAGAEIQEERAGGCCWRRPACLCACEWACVRPCVRAIALSRLVACRVA
eukprot:2365535-Pleurochrysis_carterae.AAC.1